MHYIRYNNDPITDIAPSHIVLSCMLQNTAFATWFNFKTPKSNDLCILSDSARSCMKENAYFYVAGFSPQNCPKIDLVHFCFNPTNYPCSSGVARNYSRGSKIQGWSLGGRLGRRSWRPYHKICPIIFDISTYCRQITQLGPYALQPTNGLRGGLNQGRSDDSDTAHTADIDRL